MVLAPGAWRKQVQMGFNLHKSLSGPQLQDIPTPRLKIEKKLVALGSCSKAKCGYALTAVLFPGKQTLASLLQLRRVWGNALLQFKYRACFGSFWWTQPGNQCTEEGLTTEGHVSCDMKASKRQAVMALLLQGSSPQLQVHGEINRNCTGGGGGVCELHGGGWATLRQKSCALGIIRWKHTPVCKEGGAVRAGEGREGGQEPGRLREGVPELWKEGKQNRGEE